MRIAVVTNLFPPDVLGGYELLAQDVTNALRARNHEVDVLCSGEDSVAASTGDGVYRILSLARAFGTVGRRDRLRHVLAARRNARATRAYVGLRGRPDAVLAMSQRRLGLETLRVLASQGAKVVATVNDDWPFAYARTEALTLRARFGGLLDGLLGGRGTFRGMRFDDAVYLSRAIRDAVLGAGAPLPEGVVCPQGVDRSVFSPGPPRPPSGRLELLFVGRLHPSKAPEVAIEALAELGRRGVDARLTIAGKAHEAAYDQALRARAEAAGVADRVRWLGFVARDALPAVYRAADVHLFPNRLETEGQGLTYLEAMACGVPVVAHPTGGARDLLDERVAQIVSSCDGASFATAILGLDDATVSRLREGAFALLDRTASLDRYVDVLEARLRRES